MLASVIVPLVLLLVVQAATATEIDIDSDPPGQKFWLLPPDERLAFQDTDTTPPTEDTTLPAPAPERRPNWLLTSAIAGASVVGATLNSVLDGPNVTWHTGNEGWFGQNTHFGGADKTAHFVDYYIVSKEFAKLFVVLGHKPENARWLAAGVAAFTGFVNELGDGSNRYGFSYEDLVMDVGGALSAAVIDATGTEDLIGFRRGLVNVNDGCDYSNEIYTADLALSGVARRLGFNIGPLKYLFLSVTYHTEGFPSDPNRSRQVGVEIGLNFKQILDDLNVRRNRWWGYALHVVFDNVRIPYTAVGYRYDLSHGRWLGPNAGF